MLFRSGLLTYDYIVARNDLAAGTATLARIIADNAAAAVSFNDRAAAAETLNSLRAEPSIVMACIYAGTDLFVEHIPVAGAAKCPAEAASRTYVPGQITATAPIEVKGKAIGTVQLGATLTPAYAHVRVGVAVAAGILLLAGLFAYGLSRRLHKIVSEPVLSLARAAREVSTKHDYSQRATKQNDDELGVLVDAFNDMLSQIQTMLAEIRAREADLEDRTEALARANEELQNANKMKDQFL